jgi:hypothetical protein
MIRHFSQSLVEKWDLDPLVQKFFALQNPEEAGLGRLL